jgi:hypothetical protein
MSALLAGRPLPPGRSLVHISVRGCVDPRVRIAAGRIGSIAISYDLIGNRTRSLPTTMPQPLPTNEHLIRPTILKCRITVPNLFRTTEITPEF